MSENIGTGFKKPECRDPKFYPVPGQVRDCLGGIIDFQIVGTDPSGSFITGPLSSDYAPTNMNPDGTFMICIESDAADYLLALADGNQFHITPAQATAYLGQWYPARVIAVLIGTTGDFSVGY
jgi:hypothetical protein